MKKTNKYKPGLYREYLEAQAEAGKVKAAAEEKGVDEDKIVIEEVKSLPKILETLSKLLTVFLKGAVVAVITALASIGLTVLANQQLRQQFYEFIKNIV